VRLTFILSYVLEGKGEAGVLALDDAHLSEGALADDTQQSEVVEVHCGALSAISSWKVPHSRLLWTLSGRRTLVGEDDGLAVALTHAGRRLQRPVD